MKKMFIIAAACLLVALAACGDATAKREPDPSPTNVPEITIKPTEVPTPTATSTPIPTPTETPVPEITSTYAKGNLTETGFESEWLNLRLVAPEDTAMAPQEELNVLMGIGAELAFEDKADYVLAFAEMTLVYEMLVKHSVGANVALSVELLPKSKWDMTEEQYLAAMLETAKTSGLEYSSDGVIHTRTLVGEEYVGVYTTSSYGAGVTVYQEVLVRKKENRIILIALSYQAGQEATGEYLLSLFSAYDSSTPLPTAVPLADTYEKGIITETGFESEWINLKFVTPEDMTMATQAEMDAVILQGAGLMYGDNASSFMDYANFQMVYEMQAAGEYGFPGVQVMVEKLAYKNMTEEEYAAALKNSLQMTYEATGVNYIIYDELYEVEIAGEQYANVAVDMIYDNGFTVCQDYCFRKKEGRIISIVLTYIEGMESYLGTMLNAFYPYEDNLCAAAYLGYLPEGGYVEFMDFAETSGIMADFPMLAEVPESNTVLASGGEWYLLLPVDDTVSMTVYECVLDEVTFTLAAGKELLAPGAGEPVLLCGNVSDIYPSFMVTITGPDGTVINYAPGLSLRDGSLLVEKGVTDITVYTEGQLEVD